MKIALAETETLGCPTAVHSLLADHASSSTNTWKAKPEGIARATGVLPANLRWLQPSSLPATLRGRQSTLEPFFAPG